MRRRKGDAHIAQRINCVNEHANAAALVAWIHDAKRQPANTRFTEGPDRQVAYAIEWALTQAHEAGRKVGKEEPPF